MRVSKEKCTVKSNGIIMRVQTKGQDSPPMIFVEYCNGWLIKEDYCGIYYI